MKSTKDIVFPTEETTSSILEILKENTLNENAINTIAFVVKKIATGEITFNEAREILKNDLALPIETAQKVADDLNKKVVPLGRERTIFNREKIELEKKNNQKDPSFHKEKTINPYREPLE